MTKRETLALLSGALMLALSLTAGPARADQATAEEIVAEAKFTLQKIWNQKQYKEYVQHFAKDAKAVMLFPQVLKGGFIVGGEGGTGVLLARSDLGDWSYPAFFTMGSASIGLQVGGQISEVMLLIMTGNGLRAILDDQVKIGGEVNGAIGPHGAGLDAATTTNMDVDILSYAVAEGAFIGANIEGTLIVPRESLNRAFYDANATPHDIILDGRVGNPAADELRRMLRELF